MNPEQRRAFLRKAILAAAATQLPRWAWSNAPALQSNPFALGVASGDPAPDGVVLWTRLVLADPALAELRIGGNFRWDNTEGFVRLLEAGFPVRAEANAERVVLHSR